MWDLFFLVREAERRVICQRSIAPTEWERERDEWLLQCCLMHWLLLPLIWFLSHNIQRGWWELSDTSKRWLIAWDYFVQFCRPTWVVQWILGLARYATKGPDLSEFDAFPRPQRKWCKMAMELFDCFTHSQIRLVSICVYTILGIDSDQTIDSNNACLFLIKYFMISIWRWSVALATVQAQYYYPQPNPPFELPSPTTTQAPTPTPAPTTQAPTPAPTTAAPTAPPTVAPVVGKSRV